MTEKDHLNRPILKLNSFKNKTDEPIDSPNTPSLATDNTIEKADGDTLSLQKRLFPSQQNKKRFYWLKKNIRKYSHICKSIFLMLSLII